MDSAYLLVYHGSTDPRPQASVERLAELVSQSQAQGKTADWMKQRVGTASLELSPVPLHQQIKEFTVRALASGYNNIQVVPLFLLPGVHVMEDIPNEVALAQQALGQESQIHLLPYLGTYAGLEHLLATQMNAVKADAWIVLAHGSRRAGSKQQVEALATRLAAMSAYWAVPPRLESRVKELVSAGYRQIGIMPYFLFAGGITDAIAQSVAELQQQFPSTEFVLAEPLGASAELADLIGESLTAL